MEDMAKRTRQYIEIRDALKRIEEKYDAEKRPLLEIQERLSGIISDCMNANNLENLKTEAGTCYTSSRSSASVQDGSMFIEFIKQGNWDMIERRANATAVKDYVKQHNQLPPGVNLTTIQTLGVRRPGKGKD